MFRSLLRHSQSASVWTSIIAVGLCAPACKNEQKTSKQSAATEASSIALSEQEASIKEELNKFDLSSDPQWKIEWFNSASSDLHDSLLNYFESPHEDNLDLLSTVLAQTITTSGLLPETFIEQNSPSTEVRVKKWNKPKRPSRSLTRKDFELELQRFSQSLGHSTHRKAKFKTFQVFPHQEGYRSKVYFNLSAHDEKKNSSQVNAEFSLTWSGQTEENLRLTGWEIISLELIESSSWVKGQLFTDHTSAVLPLNPALRKQLSKGTDQRVKETERSLGGGQEGHNGLCLADLNGDLLDDLYLCQNANLPNRLLIRQKDGSLKDYSAESGLNFLDNTRCALFIDIDNDGDQDVAVAIGGTVILMENDGQAHFTEKSRHEMEGLIFGISAADADLNGSLDLYICAYGKLYNTDGSANSRIPIPLHDAKNGSRNTLLIQTSSWSFADTTVAAGLDQGNNRWSFSAAWDDIDRDGDQDIYVANDFGKNHFYLNQLKETGELSFQDATEYQGMRDSAFGMSVSFGDANRDGFSDIYVSNMFSGAGNRITFQKNFMPHAKPETREAIQQMSQGNSLYLSQGKMKFQEQAALTGVNMGRWAWGSRQADLNNDGWLDILVGNGFITQEDTGDL